MVTYEGLFAFCLVIIGVIGLVVQIYKRKLPPLAKDSGRFLTIGILDQPLTGSALFYIHYRRSKAYCQVPGGSARGFLSSSITMLERPKRCYILKNIS